ncbi:MAG: hypothetical protein WBV94_32700 [Blastocatellia bacterium]
MPDAISIQLETTKDLLKQDQEAAPDKTELEIHSENPLVDAGDGSPLKEAKFIETLAIVATVGITWIVKRIVDNWLKNHEQGVQIDLRTDPATISTVANVPRGFVVIIDRNGKATTKQAKYEKSEDLQGWLQLALEQQ